MPIMDCFHLTETIKKMIKKEDDKKKLSKEKLCLSKCINNVC